MSLRRMLLWGVLALSLLLNAAIVGGYAHQRWVARPQRADAVATQVLGLRADQLPVLHALRRDIRRDVAGVLRHSLRQGNELAPLARDAHPGDPRIRAALEAMAQRRIEVQIGLIDRFLVWRDSLDPEQRERLNREIGKDGFVRRLLGFSNLDRLTKDLAQGDSP